MKNSISTLMYTLPLLMFIISCGESEQKKEEGLEGHKLIKIRNHNLRLYIPESYEHITIQEYIKRIQTNADTTDKMVKVEILEMEHLRSFPGHTSFYVDTETGDNEVLVQKFKQYIPLSKGLAGEYMRNMENVRNQKWATLGINSELLESNYRSGKDIAMIKVRNKIEQEDKLFYNTQYVISSRNKTFMITFRGTKDEDYQYLINKIQL